MRCLSVLFVVALASTVSADTLESVEKKLVAKYGTYKSYSATVTMKMQMGPGTKGSSTGRVEFLLHDGLEKVRSELAMKMEFAGQVMETKVLNIDNGKEAFSSSEMMGQKRVMQLDRSKMTGRAGGHSFFSDLRKNSTLKLLSDAKAEGVDCYVIEGTPKQLSPTQPVRSLYYFNKATGLLVKMDGKTDNGDSMVSMVLSDVKIDPKLDPARFVFTPDAGVDVMDMRTP